MDPAPAVVPMLQPQPQVPIESPKQRKPTSIPVDGEVNDVWYDVEDDPDEGSVQAEDIMDPEWKWPAYDELPQQNGRCEYVRTTRRGPGLGKGSPFQVIYKVMEQDEWLDKVLIKIKSPYLMEVLRKVMPRDRGFHHADTAHVPGRELYVMREEFENCQFDNHHRSYENGTAEFRVGATTDEPVAEAGSNSQARDVNVGQVHLNHLLRFLEQEYRDVTARRLHMKEARRVSFDMLWAFLKPGQKVIYNCNHTQEPLYATVANNAYHVTQCGIIFSVDLNVFDYNGVIYRQCRIRRAIGFFTGDRRFDHLDAWPVEMDHRPVDTLEAQFILRGRKFEDFSINSKNRFMQYRGPLFMATRQETLKENADGRAMIDIHSFAKMNSNYPMRNAQPAVVHEIDEFERAPRKVLRRTSTGRNPHYDDSADPVLQSMAMGHIADEDIKYAPAIVYGFSFALKKWGAFAVSGFSDISFETNAFDSLVMEPELKGLVHSLVSQYTAKSDSSGESGVHRVDPIANKGEGCIFLCYGPPGTGKTLTAESIAENLRRPLWSLSVSELGTTPSDLEKTLGKIFNVAAVWQAVVLLDEADVYLEKRASYVELNRNAMTGIFLRLLEYFRGVLFLTSNRITTFDEAFSSRISLFLCYPPLQAEQREQIWKKSLERAQVTDLSPDFVADIAKREINGREIRNAIQTAQTFARSRDEELEEKHVAFVIKVTANSKNTLAAALLNAASSE